MTMNKKAKESYRKQLQMVLNGRLNMNYETFIGIIDWRVNNYNFDKKIRKNLLIQKVHL